MTYTPDIPQSGESLGGTRDRINANFQQIDTVLKVNHVAFNLADEGKHARIDLPEQTTYPATPANEGWLMGRPTPLATFNGTADTTELAWRGESELAGGDQFFLSAMPIRCAGFYEVSGTGPQTALGRNFNIASINHTSSRNVTVTFQDALPSGNYIVLANASTSGSAQETTAVNVYSRSTTEFRMRVVASGTTPYRVGFVVFGG